MIEAIKEGGGEMCVEMMCSPALAIMCTKMEIEVRSTVDV